MINTKARLKDIVWWPIMDKDFEAFDRVCYPCQLVRVCTRPIRSTPLTSGLLNEIAVYLCRPLRSGKSMLVVTDYFSRWPELVRMRNANAHDII